MFDALYTPCNIGKLTIKNRFVVSAAVTRLCNSDHSVSEAFIRYQEDKAKGGWGLIITEDQPICHDAATFPNLPGIFDDKFADGQKEMTRRVHEAGGAVCAQLYHPGAVSKRKLTGFQPVAPSAIFFPGYTELPRELSIDEIGQIVKAFGAAAKRAKDWGYDMVEIHAAHGYLIHQFLSGNTNKRTDKFGGSLLNRNRFLLEIIAEARKNVGPDFPIQIRISAIDDGIRSGITLEESMVTCRLAENASVDSIHCSVGAQRSDIRIPVSASEKALCVKNAEAIKKAVNIPVITVGRITEASLADNAISSGRADFVAMFRASLADPEMPNKLREGRNDEINYCIGCRQGCTGANNRLEDFSCLVRPMTGRAHLFDCSKVTESKNIVVVGGGITGCEAAIFAAMRGHRVTVIEKEDRIGGRWIAAAIPPGKSDYTNFINWQAAMIEKHGIKVMLNTVATAKLLKALKADKVILACGADDFIPPVPGANTHNVVKAQDVLRSRCQVGNTVVVVGGGLVGAETADYLANNCGKKVTVIEMLPAICSDGEPGPTKIIKNSFKEHDVEVYTEATLTEVGEGYIAFNHRGETKHISCDNVVMATGVKPVDILYNELVKAGIPIIKAGDAASGKNGLKNVLEGFTVGMKI